MGKNQLVTKLLYIISFTTVVIEKHTTNIYSGWTVLIKLSFTVVLYPLRFHTIWFGIARVASADLFSLPWAYGG